MKQRSIGISRGGNSRASAYNTAMGIVISLVAIISTFLLANSSLDIYLKSGGVLAIVITFIVVRVTFYFWQANDEVENEEPEALSDPGVDRQLTALDDANEYFAGTLRTADTFRLIASRVKEIVSFRTVTLYLLDESRENFCSTESEGAGALDQIGKKFCSTDALPGRCYLSEIVEIDCGSSWHRPAAAIPLKSGTEVFGVIELEFEMGFDPSGLDTLMLDAIGTRSASLVLSSLSFERSQANALTDSTTELPNERAFHLVLENQVAESQRKGTSRPLTILALDIKAFHEINNGFGHAAADRVLGFAAQVIRENLRQMDFLARSKADEFLLILPTACSEIAHDVISRIQTGFFGNKFRVTDSDTIEVELNVGWATLGTDGDTPDLMLTVARERKEQFKATGPANVLWFRPEPAPLP